MADIFNLTDTWNNGATTFTAVKMNVTDTASNASSLLMDLQVGGSSKFSITKGGVATATVASSTTSAFVTNGRVNGTGGVIGGYNSVLSDGVFLGNNVNIEWSSTSSWAGSRDTSVIRVAAGIVGVRNASTGGAALSMVEQTAPSAPAADGVYIYAQDNGGGKTQLMALFSSGAAQQIAIQP